MKKMKGITRWLVITLLILGIISACAPAQSTAQPEEKKSSKGGEIVIGLESDIVSLDPAFNYDFSTGPVVNQIADALLKYNPDGTLAPCLAESWEAVDPTTYVYKIRQGVKFHDGSDMTVDDVIFSMERHLDENLGSYVGWMMASVEKIEKIDNWTIQVKLSQPDALWQYVPASPAAQVISKKHFEANQANFGKPEGGIIATGPFKYVSWTSGSEVVIERFDDYWDKGEGGPYLDRAIYKILPEPTTRVAGLQSGEINMVIWALPADQLPVLEQMENVNLDLADTYMNDAIEFNCQRPPFDNVKVRQGLNYSIDKAALVEAILGGRGDVGRAVPVAPQLWTFSKDKWQAAWDALPKYEKDLEKAKQLLDESGVADQINGKVITADDNPVRAAFALALQSSAKELGYDLEIKTVTGQELTTMGFGGARDYDIIVNNWGSDFPDPAGNLNPLFHSSSAGEGGANYANYKNPEVDKLLDDANQLTDNDKRADLMIKAQQIIAEDSPWIMVDYPKGPMALDKAFAGYKMIPLWYFDAFLKNIYKVQ